VSGRTVDLDTKKKYIAMAKPAMVAWLLIRSHAIVYVLVSAGDNASDNSSILQVSKLDSLEVQHAH